MNRLRNVNPITAAILAAIIIAFALIMVLSKPHQKPPQPVNYATNTPPPQRTQSGTTIYVAADVTELVDGEKSDLQPPRMLFMAYS